MNNWLVSYYKWLLLDDLWVPLFKKQYNPYAKQTRNMRSAVSQVTLVSCKSSALNDDLFSGLRSLQVGDPLQRLEVCLGVNWVIPTSKILEVDR